MTRRPYNSDFRLGYTDHDLETVSVWQGHGPRHGDVPLVMCHGLLADARQWYDTTDPGIRVSRAAGEADLVGYGADLGGLSTWGNDDFLDAADSVVAWGAETYGTSEERVAVYGTSMGGCSLNWVWRNLEKVVACALTIPVVSLQGIHDRNPLGIGDLIELAYGGEAGYEAALPTHDPSHPDNLALLSTISERVKIWYSEDDNVIAASEVEDFADATGIVAVNVGSVGHSENFDQQQVIDWLIPYMWWG